MKMITVAEKTVRGKTIRYTLKYDTLGYYWDGMDCASYRRKSRTAIERRAHTAGFDIYEVEVAANPNLEDEMAPTKSKSNLPPLHISWTTTIPAALAKAKIRDKAKSTRT